MLPRLGYPGPGGGQGGPRLLYLPRPHVGWMQPQGSWSSSPLPEKWGSQPAVLGEHLYGQSEARQVLGDTTLPSCIALTGRSVHRASGIKKLMAVSPWTLNFCWGCPTGPTPLLTTEHGPSSAPSQQGGHGCHDTTVQQVASVTFSSRLALNANQRPVSNGPRSANQCPSCLSFPA